MAHHFGSSKGVRTQLTCFLVLVATAVCLFKVNWYVVSPASPSHQPYATPATLPSQSFSQAKTKVILFYDGFYSPKRSFVPATFNFDHCEVSNCEVTWDKARLNVSDAVWFHSPWNNRESELRPFRAVNYDQIWIYCNVEDYGGCQGQLQNAINWTMTFRLDSDVRMPYGSYMPVPKSMQQPEAFWDRIIGNIVKRKSKVVAAITSHCPTDSKREEYIQQLQKYVPLDFYGKCGNLTCTDDECLKKIKEDYMFVVSFEHSFCKDYITEKLWRMFLLDTVPIVRGGFSSEDYADTVMPGSYIDTQDFESPMELGKHLVELASDRDGYAAYFQWKKRYVVTHRSPEHWNVHKQQEMWPMCDICRKLHKPIGRKTVDMNSFWCKEKHCHDKVVDLEEAFQL